MTRCPSLGLTQTRWCAAISGNKSVSILLNSARNGTSRTRPSDRPSAHCVHNIVNGEVGTVNPSEIDQARINPQKLGFHGVLWLPACHRPLSPRPCGRARPHHSIHCHCRTQHDGSRRGVKTPPTIHDIGFSRRHIASRAKSRN